MPPTAHDETCDDTCDGWFITDFDADPACDSIPDTAFFRAEYFPAMNTVREIGGVARLASMIQFAERTLRHPLEVDLAASLEDHKRWVAVGNEIESRDGVGSLVNRHHPVYIKTEAARRQIQEWLRSSGDGGDCVRSLDAIGMPAAEA